MIRVSLADREQLTAQALSRLIDAEHDMCVVGSYGDARALLHGLQRPTDVLVLDPVGFTVVWSQLLGRIKSVQPGTRLIIVTASQQKQHLFAAVRAGVQGYISKLGDVAEVPNAIRAAYRGTATFSQEQAAQLIEEFSRHSHEATGLAPRQRELLIGIIQGKSNLEIARELCLTEKTVKNYMRGLFSALGARSRTDAAVRALELDLISAQDLKALSDSEAQDVGPLVRAG